MHLPIRPIKKSSCVSNHLTHDAKWAKSDTSTTSKRIAAVYENDIILYSARLLRSEQKKSLLRATLLHNAYGGNV